MISIATPQPGELYYLVHVGDLAPVRLVLAIPTRMIRSTENVNLDYLHQGRRADKFNNKSVDHRKVDGTLSVLPKSMIEVEATSRQGLCDRVFRENCTSSSYGPVYPLTWGSTTESGGLVGNGITSIPITNKALAANTWDVNHTFGFAPEGSCSFSSLNPIGYPVKIDWKYDYGTNLLTVDLRVSVNVLLSDIKRQTYGDPNGTWKHDAEEHRVYDLRRMQGHTAGQVQMRYVRIGHCRNGNCKEEHFHTTTWTAYPSTSGTERVDVRVVQYNGDAVVLPKYLFNEYAIQAEVEEAASLLVPYGKSSVWSELMLEAMHSSTYIDNNMSMFVRDVVSMKDDFQNLRDAGVKLGNDATAGFSKASLQADIGDWERKHGRKLAKDVCNVYLPLIYGYKLTFDEAVEIGERLAEKSGNWGDIFKPYQARKSCHVYGMSHAGNSLTVKASYLANLQCKDNSFSEMYAVLQHTGLQIGLNDAWDWVPYSFCVNWALDVSHFLDSIDCYGWQCNYDLISCVKSSLTTFDYVVDDRLLCGSIPGALGQTLSVESYNRWVEFEFDPPPFLTDFDVKQTIENLWYHRTEGAALVVQRLF